MRRQLRRAVPLRDYCLGLLMPVERKSVEPLAAMTAPARVAAQHQSLLHFVSNAPWSDDRVLAKVRGLVLPSIERRGPIEAWIIDDTGFPKKGRHSVGVTRQYCGQLGKQDNCQVAVTLSVANRAASLPVAYRLYLPEVWAADPVRRRKAGVPADVGFATKPEIALAQIRAAVAAGLPPGVVLMDAGYGADTGLRTSVTELGLRYVAGIQPTATVWPQSTGPLPPKAWSGRGRPPSRSRRDGEHRPVQVKALALALPDAAWQTVTWREGSADWLSSRFARLRVRAAHRDERLSEAAQRGMAAGRVARGRGRADQVLALDPARRHRLRADGRPRQAALADRAGLSGTEAGTRSRPLRGARLAGLPSPRNPLHRRLRLPGLRAGDDSPLGTGPPPGLRETCRSRRLPIPRLRRSGPNATSRTRSPPCAAASPSHSPGPSTDVRAAKGDKQTKIRPWL